MTTFEYFHTLAIPAINLSVQNSNPNLPTFLPFSVSNFTDNAIGESDNLQISVPIGSLSQTLFEDIITKGYDTTVTAQTSTKTLFSFTGKVLSLTLNLREISLAIGTPLNPVSGSFLVPGMVPFRSLTTENAGKLPLVG